MVMVIPVIHSSRKGREGKGRGGREEVEKTPEGNTTLKLYVFKCEVV
jgi:hypothetical protein